jgi:hypothetical protein
MPYGFARVAAPTRRALATWAAGDTIGNGAVLWRLAQLTEDRERRQARMERTKAGNHSGTYFIGEVSPSRRNQVNGRPEEESDRPDSHFLAPAGKVKGVPYTTRGDVGGGWSDRLVPGFILDFQVELDAAKTRDPEAKARLVLTFTDGKKTRTIAQECRPIGGRLVVEVPDGFDWGVAGQPDAWRSQIQYSLRYELTFEKEVAVKEIDLVLWSPRR